MASSVQFFSLSDSATSTNYCTVSINTSTSAVTGFNAESDAYFWHNGQYEI